jgi:PAS domain-containing protein
MVLNNMSQGVMMFAPDTRLVFCNRRYCEYFESWKTLERSLAIARDPLLVDAAEVSAPPLPECATLSRRLGLP